MAVKFLPAKARAQGCLDLVAATVSSLVTISTRFHLEEEDKITMGFIKKGEQTISYKPHRSFPSPVSVPCVTENISS